MIRFSKILKKSSFAIPAILAGMISISAAMPQDVYAQAAKTDIPKNETDPVLIFNRVCYAQVPAVKRIQELATRFAWSTIEGEELQQFTTLEQPDLLEGWDVNLAQRLYRLGIVQSPPSGQLKENFPDFADGQATACTLVLDGDDEWDVVLGRMNTLVNKEPASVDVPDGEVLTTTWAGGDDNFKVFVFAKATPQGKATLLNVTILSKEKL